MMSDAYGALMDFNRMNLGASQQGMNQFYDNAARFNDPSRPGQSIPTGSLLEALAGGYSDSAGRIGGVQKDMNSGFGDAKGVYKTSMDDVNNLYNNSIGNMGIFRSPAQRQQDQFAMQDADERRRAEVLERGLARSRAYAAAEQRAWQDGLARGLYKPQRGTGWRLSEAR
jgi:hypothetical protein